MPGRGVTARFAAALVTSLGLLLLGPAGPASAHAFLVDSSPADGSTLTTAPTTLRLELSESVTLSATSIDIVASSGQHYRPAHLRLVRGASTEDPAQIVADLPPLPRSAYRVSWETLSSDDLHRTSGLFVFGVDKDVAVSAFVEPAPRPDEAALRWLVFLCLAAAVGGQLAARLYRRSSAAADHQAGGADAARRCLRIAAAAALGGLLACLGLLADQVWSSGAGAGRLLGSAYGARWGLREIGFGLLLVTALNGDRWRHRTSLRAALVGSGVAAASIGTALLGHADSGRGAGPTRWLADGAHVAAAATWSGVLVCALLVTIGRLRRGSPAAAAARAMLRAFGVPAALCIGVLVTSGVYLASGVVGSVDAALLTFYGRTLLVKIAIVAIIGVLGLINSRRLHARARTSMPRRTVVLEGLLAVVVLGLAALLTSGQPAMEPRFVASPALATVPVVDRLVVDLQESLAVRPNQPGRNVVLVQALDTRRPAPAPIRRVLVEVVGLDGRTDATFAAQRLTDGQWSAATSFATPGRTRLRVTVQRAGMPDATHLYPWTIGGAPVVSRPVTVSTQPVRGPLQALSAALAVLLGLGCAVLGVHRRRQRHPGTRVPSTPDRDSELEPALSGSQR